jgi:hypothetical protein
LLIVSDYFSGAGNECRKIRPNAKKTGYRLRLHFEAGNKCGRIRRAIEQ